MPTAGDPTLNGMPVPISHDPLQRITFQGFKPPEIDLLDIFDQTRQFIEQYFFDTISDMTGIDLRGIVEIVESIFQQIVDQISSLFGIDLQQLGLLDPTMLLQRLLGFAPGIGDTVFDLDAIWANLTQNQIQPLLQLAQTIGDFIDDLINGTTGGGAALPFTLPVTLGGSGADSLAQRFFDNLQAWLGYDFGDVDFDLIEAIESVFAPILDLFDGASTTNQAQNFIENLLGLFSSPTGLTGAPATFDPIAAGVQIVSNLVPDLGAGFAAIFDNWFGGTTATGTVAEVATAIESIRDTVVNGYTVTTMTSSTANWPKPADITELTVVATGSGQPGQAGPSGFGAPSVGGPGGLGGSWIVQSLDVPSLPAALDIAVGTAGARSYVRVQNAVPHTGAVLIESPPHGAAGGIATTFGFTPTTSAPGQGGTGGEPETAGLPGTGNALATGGVAGLPPAGSGTVGSAGSAGSSISAGAATKCGGGGGGGGGGGKTQFGTVGTGGVGGAGGYPGAGGGGGACGQSSAFTGGVGGAGGPGAAGVVWLFYR